MAGLSRLADQLGRPIITADKASHTLNILFKGAIPVWLVIFDCI